MHGSIARMTCWQLAILWTRRYVHICACHRFRTILSFLQYASYRVHHLASASGGGGDGNGVTGSSRQWAQFKTANFNQRTRLTVFTFPWILVSGQKHLHYPRCNSIRFKILVYSWCNQRLLMWGHVLWQVMSSAKVWLGPWRHQRTLSSKPHFRSISNHLSVTVPLNSTLNVFVRVYFQPSFHMFCKPLQATIQSTEFHFYHISTAQIILCSSQWRNRWVRLPPNEENNIQVFRQLQGDIRTISSWVCWRPK